MPEKKFAKLVAILGPGLGPSFGSSPFFQIIFIGSKTGAKTGLKTGPKIATTFANFFIYFSSMRQIFPRKLPAFCNFRVFSAHPCLRSATADHLKLPWRKPGGHILRAFQAPKFGPSFTCNMLRATRRHAIDGEKTQAKSRRSKDENGAKHKRQERNQKHAKPSSPRLHNIKFAHICLDMKKIGFTATSEA